MFSRAGPAVLPPCARADAHATRRSCSAPRGRRSTAAGSGARTGRGCGDVPLGVERRTSVSGEPVRERAAARARPRLRSLDGNRRAAKEPARTVAGVPAGRRAGGPRAGRADRVERMTSRRALRSLPERVEARVHRLGWRGAGRPRRALRRRVGLLLSEPAGGVRLPGRRGDGARHARGDLDRDFDERSSWRTAPASPSSRATGRHRRRAHARPVDPELCRRPLRRARPRARRAVYLGCDRDARARRVRRGYGR